MYTFKVVEMTPDPTSKGRDPQKYSNSLQNVKALAQDPVA